MRDELNALAADLLAAVGDLQARGALVDLPRAEVDTAPQAAWASLAATSRTEVLVGEGGMRAVRDDLGDCSRCDLCKARKNIVFGVGDPSADLVVIGEGPGEQEDLQGEPFVGPAGQMLDKMLENVLGLRRDQVYILNVVKCRPPRNRNPLPEEVDACLPFLRAQLRALRPKLGLVLGSVAYKALLQTTQGITRSRGRWHVWRDPDSDLVLPVLPTFHPAYLLRQPQDKRLTFADLKDLRARYDQEGGRR